MSNVDRLRAVHERFNARDLDVVLAHVAEELVLTDHGRGEELRAARRSGAGSSPPS